MFLKQIELQGFKSFADKTILRFDHDITGIVGPNGCGKSNINDAIRWVLGEQSVKSLRSGSSMSDIIFSGSEYRKPVNIAKVTLVFDNTARIFDSDYAEIEITRQLQRSTNEASYFINKTPCRLKDIQELIMDTGLGRGSLSIITQGNISAFADAKPEERRALFEEAAGVAKYKKRKMVSLGKLEKTQANLDRVQDLIDEIERQLVPLEKQAAKANEYIQYRNELSTIEVNVLVEEISAFNEQIQGIQNDLLDKKTQQVANDAQIEQLDQQIDDLRIRCRRLDHTIHGLQGDYTRAMEESVQLEKRKIEMDEKRKYTLSTADREQRIVEVGRILKEAEYEYEDRKERLETLQTQWKDHQQKTTDCNQQKQALERDLARIQMRHQSLVNRQQILDNMLKQPYQNQGAIRAILQARSSLRGIEGVMSELLQAKPNLEQAVQAALGGSMYHIVTKDEANARYAIGFLKKNRSGRATFLPMTVCRPKTIGNQQLFIAQQSEGFIAIARDCVQCDPKYDDVCGRLLGNVLVIDTLEHANECAKRLNYRLKIVTLDGDIVHAGGSMTGGRGKNQNSPMTVKAEKKQIDKDEQEAREKMEKIQNDLQKKVNEYQRLTDTGVHLQIDLAKLENIYEVKKQKYLEAKDEYEQIADEDPQDLQTDQLVIDISTMHARIDTITSDIQSQRQKRYTMGQQLEEKEDQLRKLRRSMNALRTQIHQQELEQTKIKAELDHRLMRLNTEYQMTFEYALTKKTDMDLEAAKDRVGILRQNINRLGNVNLDAPQDYETMNERYTFMKSQKEDLEAAAKQILQAIDEMDATMISQFTEMFDKINHELDGVFRSMFGGGRARLSMVDPEDVLHTGIDIDVQPPGKLIKNIQTFSGGEKALIAISVLFSILRARTMPLCIFDEVEAALDQANVERFARYLGKFRGQSQFIVVTHRPGTMEQCDTLYGVTMLKDGVSQLLRVELKDAQEFVEGKEIDHGNV